ncbi:MAG: type II secretion system secretin GspD [bacterium]
MKNYQLGAYISIILFLSISPMYAQDASTSITPGVTESPPGLVVASDTIVPNMSGSDERSNLETMPTRTVTILNGIPEAEKRVSLRFSRASLDQVLRYISNITGYTIVKDSEVTGDITILSEKNVTVDDALSALNSALAAKGYTAILTGNILKIVSLDNAKQAEVKVQVGSDPAKIKVGDDVITQVIPLSYSDAAELKRDLANLMPKRGDLSANARSNTLIVTDIASNVHRFAEIIKQLDAPQTSVTQIRVFTLTNADAQTLANTLNDLFKSDTYTTTGTSATGGGGPGFFRQFMGPGGGPGSTGGTAGSSGTSGTSQPTATEAAMARARALVKISVDTRTNSIIVSAPAADMAVLEKLIYQLDKDETEPEGTLVIHLKHGDASTLATSLTSLLQSSGTQTQTSGGGFFANMARSVQTQSAAQAKGGSLLGQVRIVADKDTNSLIFITSPRNFDRIKTMVESIDYARPQVMIEVIVAEKTLNNQADLGAEWQIFPSGEVMGEWVTSVASTAFNLGSISQGLHYTFTSKNVQGVIKLLQQDSKLNILSTPRVLTSDNAAATIKVGERVPFLTSRQVTDTGSVYNSYSYQDVGITLTVTPQINPDGYVSMTVHPIISKIEQTTYFDAPVIANREASTEVMVKDGETVIIGGLMKDDMTETINKVPLLGNIPLIGNAFKSTDKTLEKTELLVFLTPHVVHDAEEMRSLSAKDKNKLEILTKKGIK